MKVALTLEYQRIEGTVLSQGRLVSAGDGRATEIAPFEGIEFKKMIAMLFEAAQRWPAAAEMSVTLQRTEHPGLKPYHLDPATVTLIRTDVIGATRALTVPDRSPSGEVRKAREATVPIVMEPIPVGDDVLANSFGDNIYFKVRGHELECPGCGFWGVYTTPGLLNDPDRAGMCIKTVFVCQKRCGCRPFEVTCHERWGFISTAFLLERTSLKAFYFPRGWNDGRPWVTRERLQKLFNQYKEEKEKAQ